MTISLRKAPPAGPAASRPATACSATACSAPIVSIASVLGQRQEAEFWAEFADRATAIIAIAGGRPGGRPGCTCSGSLVVTRLLLKTVAADLAVDHEVHGNILAAAGVGCDCHALDYARARACADRLCTPPIAR